VQPGCENGRSEDETYNPNRVPHGEKDIRNVTAFGGQSPGGV